jgi:hypothetical protein
MNCNVIWENSESYNQKSSTPLVSDPAATSKNLGSRASSRCLETDQRRSSEESIGRALAAVDGERRYRGSACPPRRPCPVQHDNTVLI